jgi:hypothetical protein
VSRKVVHDLVLPLVIEEMERRGHGTSTYTVVHDDQLEEFYLEQLAKAFGVTGRLDRSAACLDLDEKIKQTKKQEPEKFEKLIKILLDKYISLRASLEIAEKTRVKKKKKPVYTGPPDRFQKQREKAKEVFGRR